MTIPLIDRIDRVAEHVREQYLSLSDEASEAGDTIAARLAWDAATETTAFRRELEKLRPRHRVSHYQRLADEAKAQS